MTTRIAKISCWFLLLVWLSSCITNSQLMKQAYKPKGLITGINTLNATYQNQTDSANGINLWAALRYCKTFKNDTLKVPTDAVVKLEYDGKRYLRAKLFHHSKLLDTLLIKAHSRKDYLVLKRHLFLVPIPFIFYYYHEAKTILYYDKTDYLSLSTARSQFVWILMAGGVDQKFNCRYRIVR